MFFKNLESCKAQDKSSQIGLVFKKMMIILIYQDDHRVCCISEITS